MTAAYHMTATDDVYLRMGHICAWRFWAALVGGDGVDGGQNDGVLLLQHVSVVEGVFSSRLCRSEVAVAVLWTRDGPLVNFMRHPCQTVGGTDRTLQSTRVLPGRLHAELNTARARLACRLAS